MIMIAKVSQFVALTTVQHSLGEDGMTQMTAVRGGALQSILVAKERVTVSLTLTASTLVGQNVEMTCVSTPNIFQQLSIPTTQLGLDSVPMTIVAIGFVTRTTTDVEMM